jgi:hypothetical protein
LAGDAFSRIAANLEATKQKDNLKLLMGGLNEINALHDAADISVTTAVLQGLRDEKTNEVINYLEGHLDAEIIGFNSSYGWLNSSERKEISLKSLQRAKDYRTKFPHNDSEFGKDVTNTFRFLDEQSR